MGVTAGNHSCFYYRFCVVIYLWKICNFCYGHFCAECKKNDLAIA